MNRAVHTDKPIPTTHALGAPRSCYATSKAVISLRAILYGIAFLWVLAPLGAAQAQRAVDAERFRPAYDNDGLLGIQGTRTPGHLLLNVGTWVSYGRSPLTPNIGGTQYNLVENRITTHALAQIGLGGRWALGLDLPFVTGQWGNPATLDGNSYLSAFAVQNPRVSGRFRFLGKPSEAASDRNEGPGLAAQVDVWIPVGNRQTFSGETGTRTDLQLLADFHLLGASAAAMLGYLHRFSPQDWLTIPIRDEIHVGLGVEVPIPTKIDLSGILEFRCQTDAGAPFSRSLTTAVESNAGARWRFSDFALTAALGVGFTDAWGSSAWNGSLGFQWAPRVHDADGDGIPDNKDKCPHLPEDFDGYQDDDGCLDPDDDGDLVPDEDDKCPRVPSEEGRDANEDGCTDPEPNPPAPTSSQSQSAPVQ